MMSSLEWSLSRRWHSPLRIEVTFARVLILISLLGTSLAAAPIPRDVPSEAAVETTAARLLFHKSVRKELKLTIPQVTAIVAEMRHLDEARLRRILSIAAGASGDVNPLRRIAIDHEAATRKATLDLANQVLEPSQRQRLRQIDRRLRGPQAFTDASVQSALQFAPVQVDSILATVRTYATEESRYLSGAVDGDDTKLREELLKLRQETLREIEATFTPAQRDAWQALLGPVVVAFDPTDFELLRAIHIASEKP